MIKIDELSPVKATEAEEICIRPSIPFDESRPVWWYVGASYLKAFAIHPFEADSSAMPHDKRILSAVRKLYYQSEEADRAVMEGCFTGSRRELTQRRNRLICKLAVMAGLTAFAVIPELEQEIK